MPPALREICDSEDEDEVLLEQNDDHDDYPIGEVTPALDSNKDHNISTPQNSTNQTAQNSTESTVQNSTDSTGELLRQAHLALMAPTQKFDDAAVMAEAVLLSSASPNVTRSKRRLTGTDDALPQSAAAATGKLKRIKTTSSTIATSSPHHIDHLSTLPTSSIIPPPSAVQRSPSLSTTAHANQIPSTSPNRLLSTNPSQRQPLQQATPSEQNSNSLTPWSVSAVGNSSAYTPKTHSQHKNSSDPLHSDDHLIGLPKEAYKPRPSRSRSERSVIDNIDFPTRPEKAIKAKRAKTISHSPVKPGQEAESGPRLFPEYPILQAPEYEALSPPLPASDAPIQLSIPEIPLLDAQDAPPAKAAANSKKEAKLKKAPAKRGRPKKNPQPDQDPEVLEEISVNDQTKTPSRQEVRVVIETQTQTSPDVNSILRALDKQYPAVAVPVTSEDTEVPAVKGDEPKEDVLPVKEDETETKEAEPDLIKPTAKTKKQPPKKKAPVSKTEIHPSGRLNRPSPRQQYHQS